MILKLKKNELRKCGEYIHDGVLLSYDEERNSATIKKMNAPGCGGAHL